MLNIVYNKFKLKRNMSDSEDEKRDIPMPKYRVRFSDMPVAL